MKAMWPFSCLLLLMSLRIKGTTRFQFRRCAWACQTDLLKEREKKSLSGWELCVWLWSEEPQNILTQCSVPAERSNSSPVPDKVYIMICKVLWGGGILWQENLLPPTRRLSFSPCCSARSRSPLSLSLSHCFIHQSASGDKRFWA